MATRTRRAKVAVLNALGVYDVNGSGLETFVVRISLWDGILISYAFSRFFIIVPALYRFVWTKAPSIFTTRKSGKQSCVKLTASEIPFVWLRKRVRR